MSLDPAVAAVRLAVRRVLAPLEPGSRVIVACSGGADSLALLSATVFEGREGALHVIGATVDHGLQDGSAAQAARVVEQMAALGAQETATATVTVDAAGLGPEAAARQARYAVLEEMAERLGAAVVLLGHTRDDQAETVLLGLTRGSGGRAIAGMRRAFDVFRRPLLDVSRADTAAACAAEGIEPWADPHNEDPRFTRVRVRHHVMPLLEAELGPGVAVALARTADLLRPDMEYLDELAAQALLEVEAPGTDHPHRTLQVSLLTGLPGPLRSRILRLAAIHAGAIPGELFHEHVAGMERLVTEWRGQKGIDLPGHVTAFREDDHLAFRRTDPAP
jgi:tRNA(Ile)-lysidine synthase